ncbi:Fc.00g104680.m01.CDS01 [Cosmosporella sp. VM-42]
MTGTDKRQGCTRGETRHCENNQAADETYVSELDHAEEPFEWPSNDARHRFGWVLEYIRTGSLPAQALSAQRIPREALKGSVLATATHPYNYSLDVVTTTHLNPDLCQEWTRALSTTKTDLEKLKADLQQSPERITIDALCGRYGILIPQLWEESTFHFGAPVYSACLNARSPMPNIRSDPTRLDADPSFDSSSQAAGTSTSAIRILHRTNALREKFGIDRPTQAIAGRAKHLGLSGITRKWPDEMDKFLEQLQVSDLALSEKYDRFQDEFDTEYSFSAFRAKLWKLGNASKSAPGPQEGQATAKAPSWLPEHERFVRE